MAYTRTRDWATVDYYAALGVATDATDDELARAFRSLAKQLHPDAGVPVEVAERFKEVTVAYEVLSNHRARRDYDAVRSGLLPRPRGAFADGPAPEPRLPPQFAAAKPSLLRWTMRRAWYAMVGGVLVTVAGIVSVYLLVGMLHRDAVHREGRIAVTATLVPSAAGGSARITFLTVDGKTVTAPEPRRVNPAAPDSAIKVLYDPRHPRDVIADENLTMRNITLWIVVIKLLGGGPVFAVLGWRARRRLLRKRRAATAGSASAATATAAR